MVKRILPCFLALLLVFTSVLRPVYAAEIGDHEHDLIAELEEIGYSVNIAGDSYVISGDDGMILDIKPNEISTFNAAVAGLTITSNGAGAVAAGTGTIVAAGLPILALALGVGVLWTAIPTMVEDINYILSLLDSDVVDELTEIGASGAGAFTLSEGVANALNKVFGEVFYEDDGSFKTSDLTFSPVNLLEYDWYSQRVYGNELTSTIYKYPLSTSLTAVSGTTLSIGLVNSPFDYGNPYSIKFHNSATGASVILENVAMPGYGHDCAKYWFSTPTIQSYSDSSGYVYHQLGVWLMVECSIRAAGEICLDHDVTYSSSHIGETFNYDTFRFMFDGVDSKLDGQVFTQQVLRAPYNWEIMLQTAIDGVGSFILSHSILETICSSRVNARANTEDDDIKVLAPGETFYKPDLAVTDAENLTQSGAKDNVWTPTVSESLAPSTDTPETDTSWFKEFIDMLVDALMVPLEWLFVPDLTELTALLDVYSSKFGWVADIYHYIEDVVDRLYWDTPPKISVDLTLADSKYDWGKTAFALDMTWYKEYKDSVDTIISGIVWIFFLWRLFRRIPDILSGAGIIIENETLDRGNVFIGRQERAERKERAERRWNK